MPNTIELTRTLTETLKQERRTPPRLAFELGRLLAILEVRPGSDGWQGPDRRSGAPVAASNGAKATPARVRPETRPMKRGRRQLRGSGGYHAVFDFEALTIREVARRGAEPAITTASNRREMWERWRALKAALRKHPAAPEADF